MKTAAGVILTTGSLVLIGHSRRGADPPKNWYDDSWTIPKGMIEPGELPAQTMMRELYEETSIKLFDYTVQLSLVPEIFTIYRVGENKRVYVFIALVSEDILGKKLHCDSMIENSSVSWNGLSELDNFMWVTRIEARDMVFNSQKELFSDTLEKKMNKMKSDYYNSINTPI